MRIFISHSSSDHALAEAVVDLLRGALPLSSGDIRCTSVDGYRLPAGADTNEQLRLEVANAHAFVGIISEASLQSAYVVFELGARWGSGKHFAPLLAPGLDLSALKGPLHGINALRSDSLAQLHQLVDDISDVLNLPTESTASYQAKIERILSLGRQVRGPQEPEYLAEPLTQSRQDLNSVLPAHSSELSAAEVEDIVRRAATEEHPGDYSTQRYVVNEQLKDWRSLSSFSDPFVPDEVLKQIIKQAADEHPNDFSTQLYFVKEQVADWKALHGKI